MAMKPNPTGNYIKEVTLPSGTVYEIVDANAREEINKMSSYTAFLGVVSSSAAWTKIEDGSTTGTILVGTTTTTVATGNIVIYKPSNSTSAAQEFIWDGSKWNFFGDISASNLGSLAYKNSISASYIKATGATTTGTAQKTSSGKFTPAGSVKVNNATIAYIKISSTTTTPSSTANYWVYTPEGTVTAAAGISGGTTTAAFTSITQQSVVTTATTGTPSSNTAGTLMYAQVTDHNLNLNQIKPTTGNPITNSGTTTMVKTVGTISASATFNGTTIYSERQSITASFSGTEGNVSVTGTFVDTVTVTTASAYATITYPS